VKEPVSEPVGAPLRAEREGAVLRLRLDRPRRRNALGPELVEALDAALAEAEAEGTALLVLQGEGPDFCAGFDLSDAESLSEADLLHRFVSIELLLARLWAAPFATLAVGHGRVYGAGADLFACCDRRLVLEEARFRFPGAGFGLLLGTRRLGERIGRAAARDLVRSGREVATEEALRLGLATACVAAEELEGLIAAEAEAAARLDAATRAEVHRVTAGAPAALDSDLAALVRSAMRPGFRQRLLDYRAAALGRRTT